MLVSLLLSKKRWPADGTVSKLRLVSMFHERSRVAPMLTTPQKLTAVRPLQAKLGKPARRVMSVRLLGHVEEMAIAAVVVVAAVDVVACVPTGVVLVA